MERIPEPELMLDEEQAIAYANADFEEPHNHFIELLKETVIDVIPEFGNGLDLGCGAADISIRFANTFSGYQIDGLDGSSAMLEEGAKAIKREGLSDRINLIQTNLQDATLEDNNYSIIFCNAMLHHLHDPSVLWNIIKTATNNPPVFIMDLMRPETEEQVVKFVYEYAKDEPEVLKRDFGNSLKAAFTPEEVKSQLHKAGLEGFEVSVVSDRHFIVYRM
jgi:ubiquinone/menaquinone biosynthesis C-methylase UbiE